MNANPVVIPIKPARKEPLAQVECLVLFHPSMQTAGPVKAMPQNCAQGWITLDVYGRKATSELTGLPTIEDLRLELMGEDVEWLLPDAVVQGIVKYVLDNLGCHQYRHL